jgi:hypothetical protein
MISNFSDAEYLMKRTAGDPILRGYADEEAAAA